MGLIGNKPNEVPTNGDLGTMAFQDASLYQTRFELEGFRNRIINGDMRIDQRNAGASVTPTNGQYLVDRWFATLTNASRFSAQQNAGAVTPPAGFSNYLGVVSLSAYSVTSSDTFAVQQRIEGFNVSDLGWGTAGARPVTLSFWARSSLTGTFGAALTNSAANRSYPFAYAIAAANTWELKTVTIPGDTSGTWLADNGIGIALRFGLGSGSNFTAAAGAWGAGNIVQPTGSVSVVGTNGATWQVTGVQHEAGSVATPFERRPYGTELALCQRYFQRFSMIASTTQRIGTSILAVPMRVTPTLTATFDAGSGATYNALALSASLFQNTAHNTFATADVTASSEL